MDNPNSSQLIGNSQRIASQNSVPIFPALPRIMTEKKSQPDLLFMHIYVNFYEALIFLCGQRELKYIKKVWGS
jgi:hypothetical protein